MKAELLADLCAFARRHSPFYRDVFRAAPSVVRTITDVPIVDQGAFWQANQWDDNRLLTGPIDNGLVFRSGGTTGAPKFSVFTYKEWELFTVAFGHGLARNELRPRDRIGNVFYAGSLYASFVFINDSLARNGVGGVCFPIGGASDPQEVLQICEDFGVDILAGVPTTLGKILQTLDASRSNFPRLKLKRLLFGGESMHADQRRHASGVVPGLSISSIGYASVDAGLLGYAAPDCGPDVHRAFGEATILEIIDEASGAPIEATGVAGRLVVTNLTRRLMPVIRYPVGDRAAWIDVPSGRDPRFVLLGRSDEAARVGPVSLYYDDVGGLLRGSPSLGVESFQMLLDHVRGLDQLTVRLALAAEARVQEDIRALVIKRLEAGRPLLKEAVAAAKILPVRVEVVAANGLETNERTGKLRRIIDRRFHR